MYIMLSPLTRISNANSLLLPSNIGHCACAICPLVILKVQPQVSVVKTAIPKSTFVCSSRRVLPIQELHISADDGESAAIEEDNRSKVSIDSLELSYVNNGNEIGSLDDFVEPLNKKVLKERIRRMRIGLANKGRVPWNKGRKHTSETRERIRIRTLEALRDPKIRKKMAEHPNFHSEQSKEKISYSLRRVWQERLKSRRLGEKFLLSWKQCIANAARKGASDQEELEWNSYSKIEQQLELLRLLQAEEKKKGKKLKTTTGARNFVQSWRECIATAAMKGRSGEQELEWGSYQKIKQEMVLLYKLQCAAKKARAKEFARVKAEKAARIKAIRKAMLAEKRKEHQERTKAMKAKGDMKIRKSRKAKEDNVDSEVTEEFKLACKLTKIPVNKNIISSQEYRGDVFNSIFPTYNKLDIEHIKREKLQKEVSLADQIKAARDRKAKLH
ncbi:hypothetical protein PIB30_046831 [Stylosanthes scabra]|uniref:Nuclease associated modular domain-containing protein n=1 Tax=Stylosanthes scabra TaxID=79078 RepID=A0ABU6UF74_9FABA|nr:hypothetical protein [Stylosanthes scabra]